MVAGSLFSSAIGRSTGEQMTIIWQYNLLAMIDG